MAKHYENKRDPKKKKKESKKEVKKNEHMGMEEFERGSVKKHKKK